MTRSPHALDNPVWSSLASRHRRYARGGDGLLRYPADVAPFVAAAADATASAAALPDLVAPDETVFLLGPRPTVPPGWQLDDLGHILQMVGETSAPTAADPAIVKLADRERPAVLELAALVYPHYFRARTMELGRYFGILEGGTLVAMIGERMDIPGYREISAVCTHPDFTGRGLARRLLAFLTNDIVARGDTPFLHVSPSNERAVRLYQQNGYRTRTTIAFASLRSTEPVHAAGSPDAKVEIAPWSISDRDSFRDLNLAWLGRYFRVEPHDLEQLDNPETTLRDGGEIFMARHGAAAVGTCTLVHLGGGRFELAKLAVDEKAQRHGVGRLLCDRVIRRFKERGGLELILQTNTKLAAAVRLYRRLGFVEYEPSARPEYERTNLFMRYGA